MQGSVAHISHGPPQSRSTGTSPTKPVLRRKPDDPRVDDHRSAAMAPRLKGRFALVTGSSRGIGLAVAQRFATEGATVAINHSNDGEAAAAALASLHAASRGAGHGDLPHRIEEADVANAAKVEAMIDRVVAAWGRLDILVNNA